MLYYLFAILDNVGTLLIILSIVSACFGIFLALHHFEEGETELGIKSFKRGIITSIIFILLATFIPSQKQAAFIIAAPYLLENKDLQDASKNSMEIIKIGTDYLKEILLDKTTKQVENE